MKKILSLLSVILLTFGCYDDSDIRSELRDHEERLAKLETLCKQMNTNISALQTIVSTLQKNVYVTAVTPIKEGSDIVGYTISFSNSESVTIYHGQDGADGEDGADGINGITPSIGVRQDTDGIYYWTLDGEWLLDATGKKVQAVGRDGSDGAAGENGTIGKTPQLKIENGYWMVSYDGEKWTQLGKATGESANLIGITQDEKNVYFTLTDGTVISIPKGNGGSQDDEVFVNRIQSLNYIPEYSDRKVKMSDVFKTVCLDLLVSPSSQAKAVQQAWDAAPDVITAYFRMTKFPETRALNSAIGLKVSSIVGNADGTLHVELKEDPDNPIDAEFFRGENDAVVYIRVSDGNSDIFSDIIAIRGYIDYLSNRNLSPIVEGVYRTANCYIVTEAGTYSFKAYKGNSQVSFPISSVEVLWETYGVNMASAVGDLIKSVSFLGDNISFQTAETFKEGNAVIAAKDANDKILWSWHIWLTDQPQAQVYNSDAGTMMDRNLGATSATPGDVGALGLLYQWGRKDPFLGSSSISSSTLAKSTITWPSPVVSSSATGTVDYVISNPTTFVTGSSSSESDWHYALRDNTLWTTSDKAKSIYDPCPAGWRVPDGGSNGIWSKSGFVPTPYNSANEGMSFSIGSSSSTWYPASGYRDYSDGSLDNVGYNGNYWSASPNGGTAYSLGIYGHGAVSPSGYNDRAGALSVRCLQE